MSEKVNKPFNTATRRLKPGMHVTAADVVPLDFEHLKTSGFIGAPKVTTPKAETAPASGKRAASASE